MNIEMMREARLRWYGHAVHSEEESVARRAMRLNPEGKRPCGRPKKRWMDRIKESMKHGNVTPEDALNRKKWRASCQKAGPCTNAGERDIENGINCKMQNIVEFAKTGKGSAPPVRKHDHTQTHTVIVQTVTQSLQQTLKSVTTSADTRFELVENVAVWAESDIWLEQMKKLRLVKLLIPCV